MIVCCYNGEATVAAALESAFSQSIPSSDYEVILIDDGSTDDTATVAGRYLERHPNLHYVRSNENLGLAAACNLGLETAQGRYVIRLDDDDAFESGILEAMVMPLEEDRADLVYSDRLELIVSSGQSEYISLAGSSLFQMTAAGVMMRRDLLTELGGYRPLFWEEYDLYIRYAQNSRRRFFHIPQALYVYNRRPGSLTMTRSGESVRLGWQELKSEWGEETLREFGWDPTVLEA